MHKFCVYTVHNVFNECVEQLGERDNFDKWVIRAELRITVWIFTFETFDGKKYVTTLPLPIQHLKFRHEIARWKAEDGGSFLHLQKWRKGIFENKKKMKEKI